jgi:2-oxoglutarate ferredoxin oxidoreductase subunit delta
MVKIEIDEDLCKGCGLCILFCPQKVLEPSDTLNKKGVFPPRVVKEDKCVKCCLCELICPDFAISISEEEDTHGVGRNQEGVRAQSTV